MIGIIGFGINGAYISWQLKKKGYDLKVFELQSSSKKVCYGLISDRIWNFIPKSEKLVKNTINNVMIHFPNKIIDVKFKRKMLVFDRNELNEYVANLAKNEGAKINYNSRVNKMNNSFHLEQHETATL